MNWEKMDFRFERMEVYQLAIEISDPLFEIAEKADQLRKYRFAS
jgi:hypothetical protein